jgi:hypothetical protein
MNHGYGVYHKHQLISQTQIRDQRLSALSPSRRLYPVHLRAVYVDDPPTRVIPGAPAGTGASEHGGLRDRVRQTGWGRRDRITGGVGLRAVTGGSGGQVKTHLQHLLTATAINFVRVGNWFAELPHGKARCSSFVKLMTPALAS